MSAVPLKADIRADDQDVPFVPKAEIRPVQTHTLPTDFSFNG
jgi:hypothetical protein